MSHHSRFLEKDIRNYKRISILGISGSGKSTFARKLSQKLDIPVYHMDNLFWGPEWQEMPERYWTEKEAEIHHRKEWILEGYIEPKHRDRLNYSDLIIYLDISGIVCAMNGFKRSVRYHGRCRPELPGCEEKINISYLWTMLMRKERPEIEAALSGVKHVLRITSQSAANRFLEML